MSTAHRDSPSELARVGRAKLPTTHGNFAVYVFTGDGSGEHLALVFGDPGRDGAVPVRLHSSYVTGDVFASLRCDCGQQLDEAIRLIAEAGAGVVFYLDQEGRGIGLANKIRAYERQDAGLDTVDANTALGFDADQRSYAPAASMLREVNGRCYPIVGDIACRRESSADVLRALAERCGAVCRGPHERVPTETYAPAAWASTSKPQ